MTTAKQIQRAYQISRQHMSKKARENWRSLKVSDPSAFSAGAKKTFRRWLAAQITASPGKSVSVGWAVDNASFVLDVNINTVKAYMRTFTCDAAEFESDGAEVWLRKDGTHANG